MQQYFSSTVTSVGADAHELIDGGVVILFGEPCPQELADVSVLHVASSPPQRDPRPGDTLRVADDVVTIEAVGGLAGENLRTLGHVVVYLDPEEGSSLLPGALHARGRIGAPPAGAVIELIGA